MNIRESLRTRPWLIAVAIVGLVALWMASGGDRGTTASEQDPAANADAAAEALPTVQARLQAAEPVTRSLTVYGRTAPARTVELKAETSGRVVEVAAPRGARLDAGALIVRLDDRDRAARISEAKAVLRQREVEYQGQLRLKPEGYVSDTMLAETEARLEAARAELRRAELDLEHRDIRAPFAGALQERQVEVGDFVSEGDPIGTYVDERDLVVVGSVAEQHSSDLKRGARGKARLATGQVVEGTLRYVAPVADQATRTFAIELLVDNREGTLPAGVTAEIELPIGTVLAHRVSPALLTLNDAGDLGIKLVNPEGEVEFHPARVARSSADGVWLMGLPDPARIITVGQGFVPPGRLVQVETEASDTALAAQDRARQERLK
ncbi:MAG TPA: efflux RND transporter periplasmic adaptor subunit [Steroidobacteraceae bacterium]|nr:efflux RND transporter periplasmic adaptor subunit [Steroidobacteraceae bacterium]